MLLRDNTARAKQVISIFWIMLGITILSIAAQAWRYILLDAASPDVSNVDMEMINMSDMFILVVTLAYWTIFILATVFFIMWFRRAYYNLHQLSWHNARYREGWAAGSWFVPVINLWWPYQIMVDIWNGIQNALRQRLGEPQSLAIVGWWWAFYLIQRFAGNMASVLGSKANDIESLLSATRFRVFADLVTIPAIVLAIRVVQRTSYFEKELLIHSEMPSDSIFSDDYVPPQDGIDFTRTKGDVLQNSENKIDEPRKETGNIESKIEN